MKLQKVDEYIKCTADPESTAALCQELQVCIPGTTNGGLSFDPRPGVTVVYVFFFIAVV